MTTTVKVKLKASYLNPPYLLCQFLYHFYVPPFKNEHYSIS
jgi:hypothetical protein